MTRGSSETTLQEMTRTRGSSETTLQEMTRGSSETASKTGRRHTQRACATRCGSEGVRYHVRLSRKRAHTPTTSHKVQSKAEVENQREAERS